MAKGSVVKTLLAGIAGGAIALSGGAAYEAIQGNTISNQTTTTSSTSTSVKQTSVTVSSDITKAVSTIKGAVVSIQNYQGTETGTNASQLTSSQLASEGSGVIYKRAGGKAYIVTNNHVISGGTTLEVLLSTGQKATATVVGSDAYSDLAVLTIDDKNVTATATFADSTKLTVGEPAIAVGSPLGIDYANTATEGIVSSLSRTVSMQGEDGSAISTNAIQTDAAINPGNSGGALVNVNGQVIGITSSKIVATPDGSTTVEGMGFAIPSNDVVNIIAKLEKDGKIIRPALGVEMTSLANLTSSELSKLNLPSSVTTGSMVVSVQSGMPAADAGLQTSDVITKVGDTAVQTPTDVQTALYKYSVGDTIKLTVYRGSQQKTISVKLDKTSSDLKTN